MIIKGKEADAAITAALSPDDDVLVHASLGRIGMFNVTETRKRAMKIVKDLLPLPIRNYLRNRSRTARFAGLSTKEIFDNVYRDSYWGVDEEESPISGRGSHEKEVVEPYVEEVSALLTLLELPTVVDMGCGDFNVGKRLVAKAARYLACDISETIIEINRKRFASENLQFRIVNLIEDPLPRADVCLIRQVLQHLSNRDILAFVDSLHAERPYRYLIVSEHVAFGKDLALNQDKPTGPGTRVESRSGVDLELAPFKLKFRDRREMLAVRQDNEGVPARIVTTLYTF